MICLHCRVAFHDSERLTFVGRDADNAWGIASSLCPSCNRLNLFLANFGEYEPPSQNSAARWAYPGSRVPIRPRESSRPPCPPEVPEDIRGDYREACLVLPASAKASAALSRRCLQVLLRSAAGVKPGNLAAEIQQILDGGTLPSHLAEVIDAVRNIGNFAAHPQKSTNSGLVLPVEAEEAEWNLDVLEALFDHYYALPAITKAKRGRLNAKLKEVGKPPLK